MSKSNNARRAALRRIGREAVRSGAGIILPAFEGGSVALLIYTRGWGGLEFHANKSEALIRLGEVVLFRRRALRLPWHSAREVLP